jgi:hypothetical protein
MTNGIKLSNNARIIEINKIDPRPAIAKAEAK